MTSSFSKDSVFAVHTKTISPRTGWLHFREHFRKSPFLVIENAVNEMTGGQKKRGKYAVFVPKRIRVTEASVAIK